MGRAEYHHYKGQEHVQIRLDDAKDDGAQEEETGAACIPAWFCLIGVPTKVVSRKGVAEVDTDTIKATETFQEIRSYLASELGIEMQGGSRRAGNGPPEPVSTRHALSWVNDLLAAACCWGRAGLQS